MSASGHHSYIRVGGEVIGHADTEPIILKTIVETADQMTAVAGTLEGWKSEVAALVRGNDLPAFLVACAFAAPLLDVVGEGSGGFHINGPSKSARH
jgi:putative DNA primase/helicase